MRITINKPIKKILLLLIVGLFTFTNASAIQNPYSGSISNDLEVKISKILDKIEGKKVNMGDNSYNNLLSGFITKLNSLLPKYSSNQRVSSIIRYIVFELEELQENQEINSNVNNAYIGKGSSAYLNEITVTKGDIFTMKFEGYDSHLTTSIYISDNNGVSYSKTDLINGNGWSISNGTWKFTGPANFKNDTTYQAYFKQGLGSDSNIIKLKIGNSINTTGSSNTPNISTNITNDNTNITTNATNTTNNSLEKYYNNSERISIFKNDDDTNNNHIQFFLHDTLGSQYTIEENREVDIVLKNLRDDYNINIKKINNISNFDKEESSSFYKVSDLKKLPNFLCDTPKNGKFNCLFKKFKVPNAKYSYHNGYKRSITNFFISINDQDKITINIEEKHPNKDFKGITNRHSSTGYEYLSNTLPEKLYSEYDDVAWSKVSWVNLPLNKRKRTLYWEGLKLKNYNGIVIDDVSKRFHTIKNNTTIFEEHAYASGGYSATLPTCIDKNLISHIRLGPCVLGHFEYENMVIKGSNIYSSRFRAWDKTSTVSTYFPGDMFDTVYMYGQDYVTDSYSIKVYPDRPQSIEWKALRERYGIKEGIKIDFPVTQSSISKIPGDFSYETSCTSLSIYGTSITHNPETNNKKSNCNLKEGEMYYFNSRPVKVDYSSNKIKEADCGEDKLCFIFMGTNASNYTSKYPVFDQSKTFARKK